MRGTPTSRMGISAGDVLIASHEAEGVKPAPAENAFTSTCHS